MEFIKSSFCLLLFAKCVQISESKWSAEGRIGIRLFTDGPTTYVEEPLEAGIKLFSSEHYKKYLPMVILIHGMDATVDCEFVEGGVKAMFFKGVNKVYNILALNLPELMAKQSIFDKYLYTTALNSKIAGKAVGDFINEAIKRQLTSPEKIHVIGYSMGAQVAGYMARLVKDVHGSIHFIMGLDPAGIGFTPGTLPAWYTGLVHVAATDARYVHFMHCNSAGWGTFYHNATANFIFNGGSFQPGCATSKNLGCSHNRVPFYFIESILFPEKFPAQRCDNWDDFSSCQCSSEETRQVTFPPDLNASGNYYLRTNPETPFGQGEPGLKCIEENKPKPVPKEVEKVRKAKIQSRKKYVKKVHKDVHPPKPRNTSKVYQHRTMDDYEKHTPMKHHTNKEKTHEHSNKTPTKTEDDSSIDVMLHTIHHNLDDEK